MKTFLVILAVAVLALVISNAAVDQYGRTYGSNGVPVNTNYWPGLQPASATLTNVSNGDASSLTFTNAAGSTFRLIVNTSTNGFTFVAQ